MTDKEHDPQYEYKTTYSIPTKRLKAYEDKLQNFIDDEGDRYKCHVYINRELRKWNHRKQIFHVKITGEDKQLMLTFLRRLALEKLIKIKK